MTALAANRPESVQVRLVRQLGLFDATMVVMGGIIGSGIFINPYVVARQVHTSLLILAAWVAGGVVAIAGAFIWAELAATLPEVGGQYAYLRTAYHPAIGFLYGWVLLLVIQTGGMAAVTITFARYFMELTGIRTRESLVGIVALGAITLINCLGVKNGGRVQSALMVLKIAAIAGLVFAGFVFTGGRAGVPTTGLADRFSLGTFGAAMVPVLFAYGGWQTANFIAGEIKQPRRDLPLGLLIGVAGVMVLYTSVNLVFVRTLGPEALAVSSTPATAVMRVAMGQRGVTFIATAVAISALGFLTQAVLTAPRVYFAMARDGIFFRKLAELNPRTHVPVVAIVLQTIWTSIIMFSGRYEQILNYVVSMDFLFFGLTASTLFIFRRRSASQHMSIPYRMPGHPVTTLLFVGLCLGIVANTIYRYPQNTLIGMGFLLAGLPAYLLWSRRAARLAAVADKANGRGMHD